MFSTIVVGTDGSPDATRALAAVAESRGQGLAKRALNGSVSTKVVHHAPCAVLVVKDD